MNQITGIFGYWDGPIGGFCTYEGRELLFRTRHLGGWVQTEDGSDACCVPRLYRLYDFDDQFVTAAFDYEFEEAWRSE